MSLARYAMGELNGDGAYDAAVLLVVTTVADEDHYRYLAAVVNQEGRPHNVATVLLGDRVEVRDLVIHQGRIRVKVVSHERGGPVGDILDRDREVWWTYRLRGDELVREP